MDKVKLALEQFKKYHFWVLCGAAVVVALLCWTWATADLSSRYDKRSGELEQHFDSLRRIQGNPALRNEGCVEATRVEHVKQKNEVLEGWRILYEQQKRNNPLPKVLGDDFRLHFESLKPGQDMQARFRERYLNFIERHYPNLLRQVDIRRPSDVRLEEFTDEVRGTRGGARRPGAGGRATYGEEMGPRRPTTPRPNITGDGAEPEPDPWVGLVEWPQPEIFDITAGWAQTPTTQQVLLAQEDLWVYEALLRIIGNVNEGVESHDKAWIKRINALEIGRPAAAAWVARQQPIFAEPRAVAGGMGAGEMGMEGGPGGPGMGMGAGPGMGAGAGPGMGMGMAPEMGMSEMGEEYGGRGGMGRTDAYNLIEGRYVDENGMPLSAQQFETQPPYAEFKMMMVHMDLHMHQRRIPKLLVECANSAMPIEVVRVRINPGQAGASQQGERGGATGRRPTAGPRIIREGGMGGAASPGEENSDYLDVEVFGIIYIYNPPDLTKLGTGAAGTAERPEDPAAAGPGEQPPAQVPTPTQPAPTQPVPTQPATPAVPPDPGLQPGPQPDPQPGVQPGPQPDPVVPEPNGREPLP